MVVIPANANPDANMTLSACYMKAIVVSNDSTSTQDQRAVVLGYGEMVGVEPDNLWGLSTIFSGIETLAKVDCSNLDNKALEVGKRIQKTDHNNLFA